MIVSINREEAIMSVRNKENYPMSLFLTLSVNYLVCLYKNLDLLPGKIH